MLPGGEGGILSGFGANVSLANDLNERSRCRARRTGYSEGKSRNTGMLKEAGEKHKLLLLSCFRCNASPSLNVILGERCRGIGVVEFPNQVRDRQFGLTTVRNDRGNSRITSLWD